MGFISGITLEVLTWAVAQDAIRGLGDHMGKY